MNEQVEKQALEEMLSEGNFAAAINELKNGRITDLPNTTQNVREYDPKLHDINDPKLRPDKLVVVDKDSDEYGEVKNINPNVECTTEQGYRIEAVNRVALAIQKLITKRAVAFTFGNPVNYNATPEENTKEADVLKAVNRIFHDVKERTINRKVARSLYSSTEVAELWYPVETREEHTTYGFPTKRKFKVAIFSPALGDKLYPYFDETRDMVAFSREFSRKDKDMKERTYFETYTADKHYMWYCDGTQGIEAGREWTLVEDYPKDLTIGKIPVIYGCQPQTEWEDVQPLIDRLEKLLSNFADTNDYHASPKIFVEGHIVGFARKGEAGGIIEGEEGAKASYLSWQSAPESVKLEIETLLRMIYTITQTPDISFDTVKGIGAVSGIALKLLFMDAHLKVQDKCEIFDDYLQRRVNVVKAFLKQANAGAKDFTAACDSIIVEPEIVPYIIEDELSKINLLQAANGQKPIASQQTTVRRLGWADNPDEELERIAQEQERDNAFYQGEPTI